MDIRFLNNTHYCSYFTGWWFGTWLLFFHSVGKLGMSSSHLTHIFQRGRLNHQPLQIQKFASHRLPISISWRRKWPCRWRMNNFSSMQCLLLALRKNGSGWQWNVQIFGTVSLGNGGPMWGFLSWLVPTFVDHLLNLNRWKWWSNRISAEKLRTRDNLDEWNHRLSRFYPALKPLGLILQIHVGIFCTKALRDL